MQGEQTTRETPGMAQEPERPPEPAGCNDQPDDQPETTETAAPAEKAPDAKLTAADKGKLPLRVGTSSPAPDTRAAAAPVPAQASPRPAPHEIAYPLKTLRVPAALADPTATGTREVRVVMQTESGPCPLLALCNCCVLRGQVTFPHGQEAVSFGDLVAALGDLMLRRSPESQSLPRPAAPVALGDYHANLDAVLQVIPTLQSGLDVNVRFSGIHDFELTPALLVFDLFDVRLCHGWLPDPQDSALCALLRELQSYNGATNYLVEQRSGSGASSPDAGAKTVLLDEFLLHEAASQLTPHGLAVLRDSLAPGFVGALFWNNHFQVVYKPAKGDALYLLVTDAGYLDVPEVAWQRLDTASGAGQLLTDAFVPLDGAERRSEALDDSLQAPGAVPALEATDHALALALQEQEAELERLAQAAPRASQNRLDGRAESAKIRRKAPAAPATPPVAEASKPRRGSGPAGKCLIC